MIAPILDAADLDRLRADGAPVVLCDVRWYLDGRSGRAAYEAGHLPGAVFVDLETVLSAPASPEQGRHPLPSPEAFAAALGALGIGDEDIVVAYDDDADAVAARLVFMLRIAGFEAALLDGGIDASTAARETGTHTRPPVIRTVVPWPESRLASIALAADPATFLIDARPAARYAGESETTDARAGHIPGAHSLPCRDNVGPDGRFLARAALRARLVAIGLDPETEAVSYCGSGVTACQNLLVLEHAGFAPGRLYPGSWSQYAADPTRPAATGPDPAAPSPHAQR